MNAIGAAVWHTGIGVPEMDKWFSIYDNHQWRGECPDSYHDELLRQADEMDRRGLIDWRKWRDLRVLADKSYLEAVAGIDFHACPAEVQDC